MKSEPSILETLMTTTVDVEKHKTFGEFALDYFDNFKGNEEQHKQLVIDLKLLSQVFSENERVAQRAITEIKNRIEGENSISTNIQISHNEQKVELIIDDEEPFHFISDVPKT